METKETQANISDSLDSLISISLREIIKLDSVEELESMLNELGQVQEHFESMAGIEGKHVSKGFTDECHMVSKAIKSVAGTIYDKMETLKEN